MEERPKIDWEGEEEDAVKSQDEEEKPPPPTPSAPPQTPVPTLPRKLLETPAPPATSLIASAVNRAANIASNVQAPLDRIDRLTSAGHTPLRPLPSSWTAPARASEWIPTLMEMWVRFPGHDGPVWGWFRESAGNFPDTFFGSDGEVRVLLRAQLDE